MSRAQGKSNRVVFLGLSPERAEVWMDGPYELSLAQAITSSLNYENRLYLNPDQVDSIAFTA